MPAPHGYIDRFEAERITGRSRQTLIPAAKRGEIPGAFQRKPNTPWYFTVKGCRFYAGIPDDDTAAAS